MDPNKQIKHSSQPSSVCTWGQGRERTFFRRSKLLCSLIRNETCRAVSPILAAVFTHNSAEWKALALFGSSEKLVEKTFRYSLSVLDQHIRLELQIEIERGLCVFELYFCLHNYKHNKAPTVTNSL